MFIDTCTYHGARFHNGIEINVKNQERKLLTIQIILVYARNKSCSKGVMYITNICKLYIIDIPL